FSVLVLEKDAIGGNLLKIADLENYAGFMGSGAELARTMKEQAKKFGAKIEYAEVLGVLSASLPISLSAYGEPGSGVPTPPPLTIRTGDKIYYARAVIIANGMKQRELNIEGLKAPIHSCATCDAPVYKDKKVAVIGGGDSAFQTALFLAGFAARVYIISRSAPRVKGTLLKRVEDNPKITVMPETTPTRELLDDELQIASVFLEIGSDPHELPRVAPELEGAPNVLRAGDCHEGTRRQVVAAAADGALAAEKIRQALNG
ncbi:NAD(P)-binding domain-containing protein, partial [Candidatus Saccharibacteria bacterium]|nr:NAD(P)-binding domain-containing protein [Candidatus Saccharibacteria bacterium]